VQTVVWSWEEAPQRQLAKWLALVDRPGLLHLRFDQNGGGGSLDWTAIEAWTRSRAVTVADIRGRICSPALDVALCSDLVYLRRGAVLAPDQGLPSAGVLWAVGRAGRPALARVLLCTDPLTPGEAVAIGIAHGELSADQPLPVSAAGSLTALTIVRDLIRSSAGGASRLRLELAAFRLLFASGDPREGAEAFLERRKPEFDGHRE
jgi:enoyl-CoA hydratase/carnithine racemase